ncbi:peptide ABC transporter substrate-binding protein [Sulfitobacter sp. S190]|uniref:peptide ABC transporter substrate-binding protein n=1 Tax=Sulfitobacter sp. S190 TaxID=2867022 RepID=UPI0021A6737C|nr:peptide ABC transporter substrate-binding protein [Sulfitobacter sp. S190]UWR23857.1 peptide ABC transporter substrate-binding protein [Sulfitobacter sp. S190]
MNRIFSQLFPTPFRAAAIAVALLCCLPADGRAEGSEARFALVASPRTLDPRKISLDQEFFVVQDLHEGLLSTDQTGAAARGVARAWEVAEDGLSWEFELDPEARWSDGQRITAGDFVRGFRLLFLPDTASPYAASLNAITGAQAIIAGTADPETLGVIAVSPERLRIELDTPVTYLEELLSLPAATPARAGPDVHYSGAYMLVDQTANDRYTLVANPHYRDAAGVDITRLTYQVIENADTCVRLFRVGDIDICPYIPTDRAITMDDALRAQLYTPETVSAYYYALNVTRPPLDDRTVRRALDLLIDRDVISGDVLAGLMPPLRSIVPAGVLNYPDPGPTLDFLDMTRFERTQEAQRLLRAAGISPQSPLTLTLAHSAIPDEGPIALHVADVWGRYGINVEFSIRDFAAHYEMFDANRDYDVATFGWLSDNSDATTFLELFLIGGSRNISNRTSDTVDRLLARAAAQTDKAARAALLVEAEQDILDSHAVLPLVSVRLAELISERVQGRQRLGGGPRLTRHLSIVP